jgi:predicted secreted protein
MSYTTSQAFAGRGSFLEYGSGSPVVYTILAEVKTIAFNGRKFDLADVTNMQSGFFREWLPTLADSGDIDIDANFIPGDTTQHNLNSLFNNATLSPWEVVLPNSLGTITFNAYVINSQWDLPVDKEAKLTVKLKVTGMITTSF